MVVGLCKGGGGRCWEVGPSVGGEDFEHCLIDPIYGFNPGAGGDNTQG
jgi:hypothetical protein